MAENQIIVNEGNLTNYVSELFKKVGMSETDADFHSRALVDTNLWGVDSHGVLRVPIYIKRMQSGAVNPSPQIKPIRGSQGIEVLDGDDGPGFLVGRDAMLRAIKLAEQFNIGAVGAIRSNHFGATAIYTRLAVEHSMLGIAMTNVVPNVVAPGGSKPVVGNNPISIAVPTFGEFPFVLDISLSAVAGGKLLLASKKGEKIPLDWATDSQGRPTDEPDKAFEGFLLPMGGYKGLGLAYVVDLLCGVITGGAFLQSMKGMYKYPNDPSLTGHFMIAIKLEAFMNKEELTTRMAEFVETIKTSPMWAENGEMLIPGEIEHRTAIIRREDGIPLPANLYQELVDLGNDLGAHSKLEPIN